VLDHGPFDVRAAEVEAEVVGGLGACHASYVSVARRA
jgi:hypothetical protein